VIKEAGIIRLLFCDCRPGGCEVVRPVRVPRL